MTRTRTRTKRIQKSSEGEGRRPILEEKVRCRWLELLVVVVGRE